MPPEEVIDEEVGYITALGPVMHLQQRVDSLKAIVDQGYDAEQEGPSGIPSTGDDRRRRNHERPERV